MAVVMLVIVSFLAYIPFSQEHISTCRDALNSSLAVGDDLTDSDFDYTSTMVDNGETGVIRPFASLSEIWSRGEHCMWYGAL